MCVYNIYYIIYIYIYIYIYIIPSATKQNIYEYKHLYKIIYRLPVCTYTPVIINHYGIYNQNVVDFLLERPYKYIFKFAPVKKYGRVYRIIYDTSLI